MATRNESLVSLETGVLMATRLAVKVLGLEGNKIKLSRKAVLREQREKLKAGK